VGLKDGDVLTAVEGRSVQAEGQVVGIVMVMLARHARRISGEFWRGERRGSIVVDVPIVQLTP
jgi:S1-C subfamily serine protease